ncbi:MAG: hypothetical protein ACE367_22140 [Acidimicrobiales bacterium]
MAIDVLDMIRSLFADEETRAAMIADPEATMREQGVEPPSEAEWQDAMEQLRAEYGVEYESLIAQLEERMEGQWEQLREELEMGEPPAYIGDLMVMGDGDAGFSVMLGSVSAPVMPEPETGGWEFHHPGGKDVGYVPETGEYYVRDPEGRMEMQEAPPAIDPYEGGHHEPPPAYGEHPVSGNAHDGYTVVIDGEAHQLRYDAERGWEYRSPDAGWVGHGEGGYYHHGADGTRWVEDYEDAHRPPEPGYGKPEDGYKEPEPEYGKPEEGYKEPEYGKPEEGYKEPEPEYGKPEDGYKEPEPEYGKPEDGYKEPEPEYGKPEDGSGAAAGVRQPRMATRSPSRVRQPRLQGQSQGAALASQDGYRTRARVRQAEDATRSPSQRQAGRRVRSRGLASRGWDKEPEPEPASPRRQGAQPEYGKPEDGYKEPEPEYKEPEYGKPEDGKPEDGYKEPEPEYGKPEDGYKEPEPEYGKPEDGYKEPEPEYGKPEDGYKEPEYAKPEDGYEEPEYGKVEEVEYEAKPAEEYAPAVEEYVEPVEEYAAADDYQAVTEMPVADYVEPEPAAPAYEDLPPEPVEMAPADDMADGMMDGA